MRFVGFSLVDYKRNFKIDLKKNNVMDMAGKNSKSILLIEDNPIQINIIEKLFSMLVEEGFQILKATSGREGRKLAETKHPHLILLDVGLPDENGFEVLEKLKQNPKTNSIPVILVTGDKNVASKSKGRALGAIDYLLKPFKPSDAKHIILSHFSPKLSL